MGFEVHASFDGPVDIAIPDIVGEHLLAVIREAVTNIGRHAQATSGHRRHLAWPTASAGSGSSTTAGA